MVSSCDRFVSYFSLIGSLVFIMCGQCNVLGGNKICGHSVGSENQIRRDHPRKLAADGKIVLNRCHIKMFRMLE